MIWKKLSHVSSSWQAANFMLLIETLAPNVATKLYPHQKKAITFLLERERERMGPNGQFSSLWQAQTNPYTRQVIWTHLVTQKEVHREPVESKGSILADDVSIVSFFSNSLVHCASDGPWKDHHLCFVDRCYSGVCGRLRNLASGPSGYTSFYGSPIRRALSG